MPIKLPDFQCLVILLAASVHFAQAQITVERNLTNHPAHDRCGSYSPDGKRIVFESNRKGNWDIFTLETASGELRQLTSDTAAERNPSWHPTGERVVFEATHQGKTKLYLFDFQKNTTQAIETPGLPPGNVIFGKFSPDGNQLAFSVQFSESVFHLFVLELATQKWRQLTAGDFRHTFPNWSPDGKSLVFHARHQTANRDDEIYAVRLRTGKMRRLTHHPVHDFCPAYSPDGKRIAYCVSLKDTPVEVFLMKKNGGKKRRLTNNREGEVLPNWSPNGRALLVSAFRNGNYELCELTIF